MDRTPQWEGAQTKSKHFNKERRHVDFALSSEMASDFIGMKKTV
jgi:hypothetical protein